jgi:hypothetical protein
MKNLIYKELHLSINKFFYILPLFLALLMLIPQWFFTLVFSYFFWISVSQIYASYNAQEDSSFSSMLPVTKTDIVKSKIYTLFIIEVIHLISGIITGIIHIWLFGSTNFSLDVNVAFFGVIIGMYSLFNIVFLPLYFKTGYFFGKPLIYGSAVTLVYAFIFEFGAIKFEFFRTILEGEIGSQLIVLGLSIIAMLIMNYLTVKKSIVNFTSIK